VGKRRVLEEEAVVREQVGAGVGSGANEAGEALLAAQGRVALAMQNQIAGSGSIRPRAEGFETGPTL